MTLTSDNCFDSIQNVFLGLGCEFWQAKNDTTVFTG